MNCEVYTRSAQCWSRARPDDPQISRIHTDTSSPAALRAAGPVNASDKMSPLVFGGTHFSDAFTGPSAGRSPASANRSLVSLARCL